MAQILNFPSRPDAGYHCDDPHCIACNYFEAHDYGTYITHRDSAGGLAKLLAEWRQLKDDDSLQASRRKVELNAELGKYGLFFLTIMGVK